MSPKLNRMLNISQRSAIPATGIGKRDKYLAESAVILTRAPYSLKALPNGVVGNRYLRVSYGSPVEGFETLRFTATDDVTQLLKCSCLYFLMPAAKRPTLCGR